jgi:WhiB family redox-sensing transcriptional regulator
VTYEELARFEAFDALARGAAPTTVEELLGQPPWMLDGACREHPDVNFFPTRGERIDPARAVCSTCLVRDECLAFALADATIVGVWGGTSEKQRRSLRVALGARRSRRWNPAA